MKKIKRVKKLRIIKLIIYLILLTVFYFSVFINVKFGNISFEQLLFNIINSEGANYKIVFIGAIYIFTAILLTIFLVYLLKKIYLSWNIKIYFNIGFKEKIRKIYIFQENKIISTIVLLICIFLTGYSSLKLLNVDEYIRNQKQASKLFEFYYVDGRNVELEFPKKKRNLIYIYAESMEMTNASIENGGSLENSYIPKLEKLALENINFSNTDKLGGAFQVHNTEWTIAGLVAQTAGIPLKLSIDGNEYSGYNGFLPGVYSLGDILKDNGYNNYFIIGSDSKFGGRKDYFTNHGDYKIYDYYYAIDKKYIDDDYFVWWGYEDKKLFKYAKEKIKEASKLDEPFNFTILTVDTHFTDGYMDSSCEEIFDSKYANSIYCSDSKIYSFVKWIQAQDFYENTTVIISGDHLTMQNNFYRENITSRTIYNTIINSPITPVNEKNRQFSAFDMFPTTLASLGVKINGNKLGLGVNLFSNEKTLAEENGFDILNQELTKKSFYYDNMLLGNTYYEIQKKNEQKIQEKS